MFRQLVDDFCEDCEFVDRLRERMLAETGTRLLDWVDHIAVSRSTELNGKPFEIQLLEFGYEFDAENEQGRWYVHHRGLFVPICLTEQEVRRLVVAVDAVDDFLAANDLQNQTIEGLKHAQFRRALIAREGTCEFWICERHGYANWALPESQEQQRRQAIDHAEAFKLRRRRFADEKAGFALAADLIRHAIMDLGVDWTCDLFFAAEREYWQRRNLAARVQRARQDRLGLGWANHDHHTYRSSRKYFADLIAVFEMLGFRCRERFYAGQEAGWGAQVLEQPGCGIVIFADVDLTPEELAADFAHEGLPDKSKRGTVGLWCQLHGEAFLQAGMHHLECTFDFDAARKQLDAAGIRSMSPFTDYGYLRQAFTTGEIWPVDHDRVEQAVEKEYISREQADKFLAYGSIGSHLEILERNEGFKGFNQSGVSSIILKTDPRRSESDD